MGDITLHTIETDGSYHDLDVLKAIAPNEASLGTTVFTHSIQEALRSPKVLAHYEALQLGGLSQTCQRCPVVSVCGGGYYPHRYSKSNGFDNPSVYCADLLRLIVHVRRQVAEDLIKAEILSA